MTALAYADPELAVRTWARDALTAAAGRTVRVDFGLKSNTKITDGAATLALINGGTDPELPLERAELQFSCWAATKGDAAALRLLLVSCLHSLTRTTVTTAGGPVILADARVLSSLWSPDTSVPGTETARYIVTALVAVLPG